MIRQHAILPIYVHGLLLQSKVVKTIGVVRVYIQTNYNHDKVRQNTQNI